MSALVADAVLPAWLGLPAVFGFAYGFGRSWLRDREQR